jgi:hypothetical protein
MSATVGRLTAMAGPVEQIGVVVACPTCGTDVLQKTMIPLYVLDGVIHYECVPCARRRVATAPSTSGSSANATEAGDATTGADTSADPAASVSASRSA